MSEAKTVEVNADTGGTKMRVSWGMIERALKSEPGGLRHNEFIKGVKADEHGVELTLGRNEG